jgi:peptidoglycan hydrolase-like amidase
MIAETNQDAVKFNSFGFRRMEETNTWIETHSPNQKFGLIIDAHMVFEQLHSATAKTIPTLQQLAKIKMKDLSNGVAVSSFDHQIPELLYDCTGYMVVKTDESYCNQVQTYKDWEEPQTGFCDCLKVDLESYKLAHSNMVTDNTAPLSALQAAASLSRTYALAWIAAFIAFIDETYPELTKAKFSSA